jgi:hypothetical protein
MWSLPDIKSLNTRAAAAASKLKRVAISKRKPNCEHWNCNSRATRSYLVYDIFSDDPKAVLHLCERHDGYSGDPMEGYFTCAHCARVMIENYTWERYRVELDGETICLKCAAEAHFSDPKNWIEPQEVKSVILEPGGAPLFDAKSGVLNLARCQHVLGVEQPLPAGIKFVENAEFDSCDGHQISGRRLLDVISDLDGQPFVLVLDAAYQFAVSIGIYVRADERHADVLKEEAA